MAYMNSTRVSGVGLVERITGLVKSARQAVARRAVYDQTVRELNSLTNRELADLGISRLNIHDVARVAAYDK